MLSLGLARLNTLRPGLISIGLSATVADPQELCRWLVTPQSGRSLKRYLVSVSEGAAPDISILKTSERIPWAGHSARHAMGEIYDAIGEHATTLLFVNTRSQAELLFQELWRNNEKSLPIALHHGSLDASQRRKVELAMAEDRLRAVVATSTLDMGIDWGNVDLVVHVGAPERAQAVWPNGLAGPITALMSRAKPFWSRQIALKFSSARPQLMQTMSMRRIPRQSAQGRLMCWRSTFLAWLAQNRLTQMILYAGSHFCVALRRC